MGTAYEDIYTTRDEYQRVDDDETCHRSPEETDEEYLDRCRLNNPFYQ